MLKHRAALTMLLVLLAQPVRAFFDPPYITPAQPIAGETVSVNIRGGICDAIVGLPGYPQLTQQGNSIHILFFGVHYGDPEFCNLGAGTAVTSIGSYPPGAYELNVAFRYLGPGGSFVVEELGTIPFTVLEDTPTPVSVPTLRTFSLSSFLLALAGIAAWRLHARLISF